MGWWQVENSDVRLGDEPLDCLHAAFDEIVGHYREQYGREPTLEEWETLLGLSLMGVLTKRSANKPEIKITLVPRRGVQ